MTNTNTVLLVDTLLGLLSNEMDIPPADWSSECLARSRRAWGVSSDLSDCDPVGALSFAFAGEVWDALAVCRSARDVVMDCEELAKQYAIPTWGCPYCDDDGEYVPLSFLGGEWVCPSCGCHTESPLDDACVRLDTDDCGR